MKKTRIAMIAALSLFALANVASAEGYWTSYLVGVRPGFESRNWTDQHLDAASTTVRFDTCRDAIGSGLNTNANVRLYRNVPFWPAEDRGMQTLNCGVSATGYYGEQPTSGDFHFTIEAITGGGPMDADYVETNY